MTLKTLFGCDVEMITIRSPNGVTLVPPAQFNYFFARFVKIKLQFIRLIDLQIIVLLYQYFEIKLNKKLEIFS